MFGVQCRQTKLSLTEEMAPSTAMAMGNSDKIYPLIVEVEYGCGIEDI